MLFSHLLTINIWIIIYDHHSRWHWLCNISTTVKSCTVTSSPRTFCCVAMDIWNWPTSVSRGTSLSSAYYAGSFDNLIADSWFEKNVRYFETRPPAPEDILDTPNNAQVPVHYQHPHRFWHKCYDTDLQSRVHVEYYGRSSLVLIMIWKTMFELCLDLIWSDLILWCRATRRTTSRALSAARNRYVPADNTTISWTRLSCDLWCWFWCVVHVAGDVVATGPQLPHGLVVSRSAHARDDHGQASFPWRHPLRHAAVRYTDLPRDFKWNNARINERLSQLVFIHTMSMSWVLRYLHCVTGFVIAYSCLCSHVQLNHASDLI